MHEEKHSERSAAKNDLYIPENPKKRCTGFSYIGPKLYIRIPKNIKEAQTTNAQRMDLEEHSLMTFDYYMLHLTQQIPVYFYIYTSYP